MFIEHNITEFVDRITETQRLTEDVIGMYS